MATPSRRGRTRLCARIMAVGSLLLAFNAVAPLSATADVYPLNFVFSGPAITGTFATVNITDLGNNIHFSIANQWVSGSKLDSLYFNFNGDPSTLSFSNVTVDG